MALKAVGLFHVCLEEARSLASLDSPWAFIKGIWAYAPQIIYDFVITNSADPDEVSDYVRFHQGLHCLHTANLWVATPKWIIWTSTRDFGIYRICAKDSFLCPFWRIKNGQSIQLVKCVKHSKK